MRINLLLSLISFVIVLSSCTSNGVSEIKETNEVSEIKETETHQKSEQVFWKYIFENDYKKGIKENVYSITEYEVKVKENFGEISIYDTIRKYNYLFNEKGYIKRMIYHKKDWNGDKKLKLLKKTFFNYNDEGLIDEVILYRYDGKMIHRLDFKRDNVLGDIELFRTDEKGKLEYKEVYSYSVFDSFEEGQTLQYSKMEKKVLYRGDENKLTEMNTYYFNSVDKIYEERIDNYQFKQLANSKFIKYDSNGQKKLEEMTWFEDGEKVKTFRIKHKKEFDKNNNILNVFVEHYRNDETEPHYLSTYEYTLDSKGNWIKEIEYQNFENSYTKGELNSTMTIREIEYP